MNKTVSLLDDEFILLVEKADRKITALISKANAMKHKSSGKKKDLADLENLLKVVREKLRKLV